MPMIIVTAIQAAFTKIFTYLLGSSALKWIILAVLAYGFTHLLSLVISLIPDWVSELPFAELMGGFPSGVWYFVDYFHMEEGLSLILSAYIARFIVRRIPFLG